ncbi:hypothetical protein [Hafnia paralvei]|nr:hypothetical protein [Hafnia paralvei]
MASSVFWLLRPQSPQPSCGYMAHNGLLFFVHTVTALVAGR